MSEELHDVVKLMLARMESHPEEFVPEKEDHQYVLRDGNANRWWRAMSEVQEYANEQEKKAIAAKLRELRLQQAHEWAMDELCNGEERRRKEKRARELEEQRYMAQQQMTQTYQNAPGSWGVGTTAPSTPLTVTANGREAMRINANGDMNLRGETLNAGIVKQMKRMLGI